MKRIVLALLVLAGAPLAVFAQANAAAEAARFVGIFNNVILFPTIGLLSAVALLVFIYGCFEYIAMSGSDQAREKGVKHITWGIIGLVVMLSAFAILSIITATFGLDDELTRARNGQVVVPIPNPGSGPQIPGINPGSNPQAPGNNPGSGQQTPGP